MRKQPHVNRGCSIQFGLGSYSLKDRSTRDGTSNFKHSIFTATYSWAEPPSAASKHVVRRCYRGLPARMKPEDLVWGWGDQRLGFLGVLPKSDQSYLPSTFFHMFCQAQTSICWRIKGFLVMQEVLVASCSTPPQSFHLITIFTWLEVLQ